MDFKLQRQRVEEVLAARLPPADTPPHPLHAAMRYSVFAGGKRLRPLLCLSAAEATGGCGDSALLAAAAIEILHTYTLIHDDLPAMDDDELRRGKPTLHVVYGEANAILAGDALLTLAFEWLADAAPPPPYSTAQLVRELAQAAGSQGVIAGQVADLASENLPADANTVAYIHQHKTAALIRGTVRIGAMLGGANPVELAAITEYGEKIGLAFQIVDDILNATADSKQLGKAAGSDQAHGKMTWVAVHGLDAARTTAARLTQEAKQALAGMRGDPTSLLALAEMMANRNS